MNKAVPWNINGVGFDAREAAREAARRQGKSLGEWLHGVIADHASDLGVGEDDIGGQDRIDAVTAKLERLSAHPRGSQSDRHRDHGETERPGRRGHDEDDQDDAVLAPRFRRSDNTRSSERSPEERRPSHSKAEETELLLDDAIEAMERRTLRAERKTDKAIASFAKIIETSENKRDDEREMFTALTRKLAEMETRIASRVTDDNYRPIKGALARLEARLETLGRRPQADAQAPIPPALSLAPAVPPVARAPRPARAEDADRRSRDDDSIQRLESKLNSILDAVTSRPAATEPVVVDAPRADPVKRRLGAAIADIADRQLALATPGRRDDRETRPQPDTRALMSSTLIGGLQGDIAGLAAKIEDMRREMASRAGGPKVKDADEDTGKHEDPATAQIEALRAEVAGMARMISERQPRDTVPTQIAEMTSALEQMRRDLARRDESKLAAVASRADLDGLKAGIAGISETLSELAPRGTVTALEDAIRALSNRMEATRESHARDAAKHPLDDFVGDLRHSVVDIGARDTIGGMEREIKTIGDKLDDLNGVDVSALSLLRDQTEEIRSLLKAAAANPLAVERIERQVATLAERMDRQPYASARDEKALRSATSEIRAMLQNPPGSALFDKIESRLEALTTKVDQAVDEATGARKVAELSRRHFDTVQEQLVARLGADRPSTEIQSLETLVRDLSDRIEAVRAPDASHNAIEALQDQIVRLSTRFERTDGELSALSGIERSMHDLFAHLEETRASVETSAKTAARQAMDAVLGQGGLVDSGAAREIATLKAIQKEADHRTHATLNAVHETLEKVVDRLSSMESDIATVRAPVVGATDSRESTRDPSRRAASRSVRATLPDLMLGEADMLDEALAKPSRALDDRKRRETPEPKRRDDASTLDAALKSSDRRSPAFGGTRATDREGETGHADFIAAARRAAHVAASDPAVLAMKRNDPPAAASDLRAGLMAQTRDYVATHKKPVLLSVAALFVTLGTLAVLGSLPDGGAMQMASNAAVPARPAAPAAQARRIEPAPRTASRATLADLSPSALPHAPAPATAPLPGSDPITTGSIARLPSFAAQATPAAPAAQTMSAAPTAQTMPAAPSGMLKQMADAGDSAAQYEVASRYADGRELPKDYALAASWFEKAAQQGTAPAEYKLASLYEKGLGLPKDKAKARFWYQKAAEAGNPRAMHNLAVLIADGDGKPDYTNAVLWFRRAAEYGVHDSQYNLAILLARGLGAPQSLVQSYQWFAVAAQQNDADAATKRDEVGAKLTPNDLSVARALAIAFHVKTPSAAAVDVETPAGGWDGASTLSPVKSARQKLSSL